MAAAIQPHEPLTSMDEILRDMENGDGADALLLVLRDLFDDAIRCLREDGFPALADVEAAFHAPRDEFEGYRAAAVVAMNAGATTEKSQLAVPILIAVAGVAMRVADAAVSDGPSHQWSAVAVASVMLGRISLAKLPLESGLHRLANQELSRRESAKAAQAESVAVRTAWTVRALSHCITRRAEAPSVAKAVLADEVRRLNIGAPSSGQVVKVIGAWERAGLLEERRKKSAVRVQKSGVVEP